MADRREKRLAHLLSHAGRKDLIGLDRNEALYKHLQAILNPRTPLKLNDCRARWVRALKMRYEIDYSFSGLDIICFTFALRHFNLELIEILHDDVPQNVLELIQHAIQSVFRTGSPRSADSSSLMKVFPWGDIAQFVSQNDWDLSQKFLEEIRKEWNSCRERYDKFGPPSASPDPPRQPVETNSESPTQPVETTSESPVQVTLPSFDQFVAGLEQGPDGHE